MNPYLLIQQTTKRASAYFYSQYVLAEEWAEVPESQTAPTIKVDLLEETPLGEAMGEVSTDPLAEAVLGLYLDDQLVGKAPFTKTLTTDPDNQEFIYEPDPDWIYPEFLDSIKTIDLEMMMETKDFWSKVTHALADAAEMWEPPPPTTIRLAETNAKIYEALMAHKDRTLFEIPDPNDPRGSGEIGIVFGIWTKEFPRKRPPFPIFAVVQIGGQDTYSSIYFDAEHAVTTGYAWMADMGIPIPKDLDMIKTANALKSRVKSVMARLSSGESAQAPQETPPPPTIYKSPWED